MNLAIERPRFRNDLVAQPFEEEGVRYVDVTDPNSGATFRFYDVEYSIACAMNGARDLAQLAEWTLAELGIETSPDELANVVNTLAELGYLEAVHDSLGGADGEAVAYGSDGQAAEGYAADGYAADGYATEGHAADGAPEGYPPEGYPPEGYPQEGYPQEGYPQEGYPQEGHAPDGGDGVPAEGYAAEGYAGEGYAAEGYAAEGQAPEGEAAAADAPVTESWADVPTATGEPDDSLDLGPAGASPMGTPRPDHGVDAPELELGAPGAGDDAPEEAVAPVAAPAVELGEAGAPEAAAGGDFSGQEGTFELDPSDLKTVPPSELAAVSRPPPVPADETSFAGIMDDESPPTPPPAAQPSAALRPTTSGGADEDPTQLPGAVVDDDDEDVSVDLSRHLNLNKEEVKEAVRQSKVMMVPELPKDLKDEDDDKPTKAKKPDAETALDELAVAAQAAMPLPPPPEVIKPPPVAAIPLPSSPPSAKPIEKTKVPPPPAKKKSAAPMLLTLVFLVAAGAAGVWYFVLRESDGGGKQPRRPSRPAKPAPTATKGTTPGDPGTGPTRSPAPSPQPSPGKPAEPPSAKLEVKPGAGVEARAASDGTVAWVTPKPQAAAGEPIVKLAGFQQVEQRLKQFRADLERHKRKLERAKAENLAGEIKHYSEKVPLDEQLIAEAEGRLAALVIAAPADGPVELVVKPGAAVKANDVVARIGGATPAPTATFDAGAAASGYKPGGNCKVAVKGAPDKQAACVVDAVEGTKVTVRLVTAGAALPMAAGDEVVLLP